MTSASTLVAAAAGRRPDLRLVPAALAVWAVVLAGLVPGPETGVVVGAVISAPAAVAALLAWRCRAPVVLAAAGCAAAAAVVITAHLLLVAGHPLRAPASRAAAAEVRVVLRDDPRPIRSAAFPGAAQVAIPVSIVEVAVGAGRWTVGGRLLLLAPAEGWLGLLPGQEVTAEGLLAPAAGSDLTVAVLRVRGPPRDVAQSPWWQSAAGELRAGLRTAAVAALPTEGAGLLPGLAVGDTSGLSPDVDADFRAAGLTHLLAVSGANLAILTGGLLWLLRRLRADPRWSAVLGGLAVVGFVVLARPSPSVVRAAVMAVVVLLALGAGRARAAMPALAAAVLVLLLADPALAVDAGFALSVTATAALVLIAPGWARTLRRMMPGWAADALAVSAAACLVTAPLVAGLSGQVNPASVVANLLVAPAVAPATVLGVAAALVSPIAPAVAQACAWAAGPATWWMVTVADHTAAADGSVLDWPDGPGGALLLAGVVVAALALARVRRVRALMLAVALGLAVVLVPTRLAPPGWPPAGWSVVACDVGQGDAIVLATGRPGWAVLIDTGPDPGLVDACLSRLGVRALALVVLSHLHADHIGGLIGALRGRAVATVAVGPGREPSWALRTAARATADAGAPFAALHPGQRLVWPGLTLDVLGPLHPAAVVDPDDGTAVNDTSVVLRAGTPVGTVLLAGDAELAAQADLLAGGADLRADVLKVPHHGSRYTSAEFLRAVAPRAVLVSVGAGNTYGHPNRGLLSALEQAGATVRRTDTAGDVAIVPAPDADGDGRADLAVVARGDPLPARR